MKNTRSLANLLQLGAFVETKSVVITYNLDMFIDWVESHLGKISSESPLLSGLYSQTLSNGEYKIIPFLYDEKENNILAANVVIVHKLDDELVKLFADKEILIFPLPLKIEKAVTTKTSAKNPSTILLRSKTDFPLTVDILESSVLPYLHAISETQKEINGIVGNNAPDMQIREISQNSPISVTLSGVAETLSLILSIVIPWRRNNAKSLAQFAEKQAMLDAEVKQVEVLERRLQYRREVKNAEKDYLEISERKLALEKQRVEVAKLRLDFEKERIRLAMGLLKQIKPEITEEEKLNYAFRLLKPLQLLLESDFEMQAVDGQKE